MSHHHYEDVIDTSKKETMTHHYDDGPDVNATNERIREKQEEIERLKKEKEKLVEKQEIKNKKAYNLSVTLKKLKESKAGIEKQIIEVKKELNKYCTHEKIRTTENNYPGGYLDKSEHVVTYYCELCGIKVDEKITYGSYG